MRIDLTDPDNDSFCCGSLCNKVETQQHFERMQRAIDAAHQLLNYGGLPEDTVEELRVELSELSS